MPKSLFCILPLLVCQTASAAEFRYKDRLLPVLLEQIPKIMRTYDETTGRFGTGLWICRDQEVIYPLAAAYSYESEANPYFKDEGILSAIMKGGDALIDDMDERGRWEFRKKDGSTWGMIWMPWTYSRWIRCLPLIRDDMPKDRRVRWENALVLGYEGIKNDALGSVHNIPAHHTMGLYIAGKALGHPEWCEFAAEFMQKVIRGQSDGGYWSEHLGPVVNYNFVYLDALGTYYAMSKDERVLPALERGAAYHLHFTYPDGTDVETIDERNPYHKRIATGNVGFTFTEAGRAYLQRQWDTYGWDRLSADSIASLLLYGEEGPMADLHGGEGEEAFVLKEGGEAKAATLRRGPWFLCLSAYTAPLLDSRWIQDRQNLACVYHDKVGLVVGGGNTKLQPAWSNLTVGDTSLLQHTEGDTDPDFKPKGELYHIPSAATLVHEGTLGLDLVYGRESCRIRLRVIDANSLEYRIEATHNSGLPVEAHLALLPSMGEALETGAGFKTQLGEEHLDLAADQVGGKLLYRGCEFRLPANASLHWPALPHNPYRKDGHATIAEGRIEIRLPFEEGGSSHTIRVRVLGH